MSEETSDVDAQYPTVPLERLENSGWALRDERLEVRARVMGVTVHAHERRFEDDGLRERVRAGGGPDHLWRLFYATRLTFSPSLPPAFGPAMALPKVRSAACEEFADQLRDEGLTDVEQGDDERIETDSGAQAKVTRYDATLPVETDNDQCEVPMEGWIGIWNDDAMLLAGGLYPTESLAEALSIPDVDYDPEGSHEKLRALIRQVNA
ncbi:hypothetical protein [Halorhabdus sp. CUG00001]|uniref:hypothetical protein n=1 Tax=Halorhabdus sp. CUG00001 TaxID=2600297 RepID=UPI00131BA8E9|nr:hypothetical protein [Halorhabdus sp. CUG00001]